jgi:hypothetical protein
MSRYIDADKLKEECYKFTNDVSRSAMAFVQGQINAAPTADVVEVKHGEWVVCGTFDDFVTCSVCKSNKYPFGYGFNYCPDCGAKMDS